MPLPASPPPTVAVDLRALVPQATGIGVYTRSLLAALARRGGARWVGLAHRPVQEAGELAEAGVELPRSRSRWPLGVLWQQLELPRQAARLGADLLWSPLQTLPLASEIPGVVTVHDLTVMLLPEAHRLKVRLSQVPLLGRSLAAARRVVAVSEATAADLRFHFPACAGRLRVVGEGVEPDLAPASAGEVAAIRAELGAPEGYLLHVGTLEPRKNVGALLTVWEELRRDTEEPAPPLVLAGGAGWHSRGLRRRIEKLKPLGLIPLGRVQRPRLVRLYQGATAFVFPSLYEGFGLPPLEAMACGVPVVASAASSLPEVVGDAGLLVEPRDRRALAEALRRLLADPALAADLAARGVERARLFTWEKAAAGMEEVFGEALAEA
jgi:glycosyltransferase involved in cell wall biosynthesis